MGLNRQLTAGLLSANGQNVAANGQTADIDVSGVHELAVGVVLATLTGGAAPTVTFVLERKNPVDGGYDVLWTSAALNAAAARAATSVGPGCAQAHSVGQLVRLRWTTTGAPTGATAHLSVLGK